MNFIIAVYSPPTSPNTLSAYQFIKAVLSQNHKISQIFFYQDGVFNAQDTKFSEFKMIPLLACSTALFKRNINPESLSEGFQAGSLTQFFDVLLNQSNRYVVFGN